MGISCKNATLSFAYVNILGLSVKNLSAYTSIGPWTKKNKNKN